jgi:hypothetical protein
LQFPANRGPAPWVPDRGDDLTSWVWRVPVPVIRPACNHLVQQSPSSEHQTMFRLRSKDRFADAGDYLMCRPRQFWPVTMARGRGRWTSEPVATCDGDDYARSAQMWAAACATPCDRGTAGPLP